MEGESFQSKAAVYLALNGLFLLPVSMMYIAAGFSEFLLKVPFLGWIFGLTFILDAYYYMFGLAYLHFVLNGCLALISVFEFAGGRDKLLFAKSLAAVAFSTWGNIFLLLH